ncbi:MAG: shikimate kinase [Deltaproteobacteria bacterium]|nr:shikimate kinase [Deltaproteobacteria bacterium]
MKNLLPALLGRRTRELRAARGWTVRDLAQHSGLSLRLLALIEADDANPTLASLEDLALAFAVDVVDLLRPAGRPRPVALLGLRGAGKSTIGKRLADDVGWSFVELDRLIERESGLSLQALFELHGEPHVRTLEARVLADVLAAPNAGVVVAVGGGLVTWPETWSLLRGRALTVWLKATPQEHWDRVRAQGDERPMASRSRARAELDALWTARAPLYAQAELHVDTSVVDVDGAVGLIRAALL